MAALGHLGQIEVGTLGTPTPCRGRPISIRKVAELSAKAFQCHLQLKILFPHSEALALTLLTQT